VARLRDRRRGHFHVTNIHRRESFRHVSYVSQAALAVIAGAGIAGYGFAVDVIADVLRSR
jgi:3-dehydroquinate dehydratase II